MAAKKYWYRHYVAECPVCGVDTGYRVRVYDEPKPTAPKDRRIYLGPAQAYCGCMNWEFY